jgi:hypothetical protein
VDFAQVHVSLGQPSLAFEALERAVQVHAADLAWLGVRPVFQELRQDPRYLSIIKTLGLAAHAGENA